jgi:hypothetical protein
MNIEICDEQVDRIVVEFLKGSIVRCTTDLDGRVTEDNKAHLLSSLYRTLEHCTTSGEYQDFVRADKGGRAR